MNRGVLDRVRSAIEDVEAASDLRQIKSLKKIAAPGSFYRFRIGEYRMGLEIEGNAVEFIRCLPRRDLYRYFP